MGPLRRPTIPHGLGQLFIYYSFILYIYILFPRRAQGIVICDHYDHKEYSWEPTDNVHSPDLVQHDYLDKPSSPAGGPSREDSVMNALVTEPAPEFLATPVGSPRQQS